MIIENHLVWNKESNDHYDHLRFTIPENYRIDALTFTEFTCDEIDGSARLNIRIQKPADTNVGYVNQGVDILGYTYEIQNSNSESLLDSSGNFNVKTYDEDDFGGDDNFLMRESMLC